MYCIVYGRINNQIKIRGNRIELDEINNVALSENDISNAYSLFWNNVITLFICADKQVDTDSFGKNLKEKLPSYMLPTNIIQIERFPLKLNGKIDVEYLKGRIKDGIMKNKVDVYAIFRTIIDENNKKFDEDKLETLGIDSLDTLKLIHLLSESVVTKKSEFSDELLRKITRMNISDIREFTKGWNK